MLNQDEELKLEYFTEIIEDSKTSKRNFPQLSAYDIEWLAKKVKQLNDELSQVTQEYQKLNEEHARVMEHYEG